jgi:O-acetylhomoserine/O-acetylserine sulfhydrylase-like pyridoxal-dependent enzyme
MTYAVVPKYERIKYGITDEFVRLSVGIENVEDIILSSNPNQSLQNQHPSQPQGSL